MCSWGARRVAREKRLSDEQILKRESRGATRVRARRPLVLPYERAAELGERRSAVLEPPQDELALLDRQRDSRSSGRKAIAERARRRLIDEGSQLADDLGGDWDPTERGHGVELRRTNVRGQA
jgi:hypothetical protein